MTEKYLDFSFEKTNSAYMLFYEWRSGKGGNEQRNQSESPTIMSPGSSISQLQDTGKSEEAQASTSEQMIVDCVENKPDPVPTLAEYDVDSNTASTSSQARKTDEDELQKKSAVTKVKRKSLLNNELEDWIWQDNRHYLEDRNIFEHTYFK